MAKLEVLCGIVQPESIFCSFQVKWYLPCVALMSLSTPFTLNVRRAGITRVDSREGGLCKYFHNSEAWQQLLPVLQRAAGTRQCCGTAGSLTKVHCQSRGNFIWLLSVMRCVSRDSCPFYVGCNGKHGMANKQKFCVSVGV